MQPNLKYFKYFNVIIPYKECSSLRANVQVSKDPFIKYFLLFLNGEKLCCILPVNMIE